MEMKEENSNRTDVTIETPSINGDLATSADSNNAKEKHYIFEYFDKLKTLKNKHKKQLRYARNICLLAAYFVYFGFAVNYHVGSEDSWRLIWMTCFGVVLFSWKLLNKTAFGPWWTKCVANMYKGVSTGRRNMVFKWVLYIGMTAFMVAYVVIFIATKTPENLRSLMGIFIFPFLLFLYSNNKRKVNWHSVFWGMAIQYIMALIILKTSWGSSIIMWVGDRLSEFTNHGVAGSIFIFGETYTDHEFAFGLLPKAFCMVIGISVLTYLGVISFVVETLGRGMAFMLGTSPAEGINAIGNIFLHVPESFMLIQEYLNDMTPSQLFVTYAGGLTTVGGVALVIFMASGVPAAPLVAASAMSAPAALAACKLVFPSTKDEVAPKPKETKEGMGSFIRHPKSLADAVIIGIQQTVTLVVQGLAFICAFVVILEFLNKTLMWFGDRVGVPDVTIEFIFSYVFYPFAYLMGARAEDCLFIGKLLGTRTFGLAVVAFPKLGPIIQNGIAYRQYIAESANNTWTVSGDDIILDNLNQTLVGGVIDARSEIIATYSLCGSASLAIVGYILGAFGAMMPHRQDEITKHVMRAMVVGTVASYLTACFAGLLFEEGVGYD